MSEDFTPRQACGVGELYSCMVEVLQNFKKKIGKAEIIFQICMHIWGNGIKLVEIEAKSTAKRAVRIRRQA